MISDSPHPELVPNEFRCLGRIWWLAYAEKVTTQPANKGLACFAKLLAQPYQPISAVCLEQAISGRPSCPPGSAGELLSPETLAKYRERLDELSAEIADAKKNHDTARHEHLSLEWGSLTSELNRALGRGGRLRRAADDQDRSRRRVKMSLSRALQHLKRDHPELSAHLANSVRTGHFLCYAPEVPTSWRL